MKVDRFKESGQNHIKCKDRIMYKQYSWIFLIHKFRITKM